MTKIKKRCSLQSILMISAMLLIGSGCMMFTSAVTSVSTVSSTPEKCFQFSNGTITKYLKGAAPECGAEVVIPSSIGGVEVKSLGKESFYGLGITNIRLPEGLETLGVSALEWNDLTSITLPPTLKTIQIGALEANRLTSLTIPDAVTSASHGAFTRNALSSMIIPAHLQSVFNFDSNSRLFYQVQSDGVHIRGNGDMRTRTEVVIPKTIEGKQVVKIDDSAFFGNYPCSKLIILAELKEIGDSAFYYTTYLKETEIPDSTNKIGACAFGCSSDSSWTQTLRKPFTLWRPSGVNGLTLDAGDTHVVVNPLTLNIHYKNEAGEDLTASQTFAGTGKKDFSTRTIATAGEYFQAGKSYTINPAQLSGYLSPLSQTITFPDAPNASNNTLDITFTYAKKGLVLHYSFDEESTTTVKDKSGKGNTGSLQGSPQRDDLGRVGGMYSFDENSSIKTLLPLKKEYFPEDVTYSLWIKTSFKPAENSASVPLQHYYEPWNSGGDQFVIYSNGNLFFAGRFGDGGEYSMLNSPSEITDDKWHLITATHKNESGIASLYIDGKLVGEKNFGASRLNLIDKYLSLGSYESYLFKGQMDDVRVYNYALTPQQVQSVYASYPPEDTSIPAELNIYAPQTGNIEVEVQQPIDVVAKLYRPTKNETLSVFIPSVLKVKGMTVVPMDDVNPLSGEAKTTSLTSGNLYEFKLKDGLVGDFKSVFTLFFDRATTLHEQKASIEANLSKGTRTLVQAKLTLQAWNKSRIDYRYYTSPSVLGNDLDIIYTFKLQRNCTHPGNPDSFDRCNPQGALFYNFKGIIPLPKQAKFVSVKNVGVHYSSGNPSLSYDPAIHALRFNAGWYEDWSSTLDVVLRYEGVPVNTTVTGDKVVFSGMEANQLSRTFEFPGISAEIKPATVGLGAALYPPKHSLVINEKDQPLNSFVLHNHGNIDFTNFKIIQQFPEEWIVRGLYIPPVAKSAEFEVNYTPPIKIKALTNTNKVVTREHNFKGGNTYDASDFGLSQNEYLTSIEILFPKFKPGERFSQTSYTYYNLGVFGDIGSKYKDGSEIKDGDKVTVTAKLSSDQFAEKEINKDLPYSEVSFLPLHSHLFSPKVNYSQGEEVTIMGNFYSSAYHYDNGQRVKDLSLLLMIPDGFTFDPTDLKISGIDASRIGNPEIVTPKVPIAHTTVWRIPLNGEFLGLKLGSFSLNFSYKLKTGKDTLAGSYPWSAKVLLGTKDPKYKLYDGYYSTSISDTKGILGPVNVQRLVYSWIFPTLEIISQDFTVASCSQTENDQLCKKDLDLESPFARSNFKSGEQGTYKISLQNNTKAEVKNFAYIAKLPQVGSYTKANMNQWTVQLGKALDVSGVPGATVEYSLDGSTYIPSVSDLSKVKSFKILIPSIAVKQVVHLSVFLQTPVFHDEEAGKLAFLGNSYTHGNGGGTYDGGTIGLRLVASDFSEDKEAKYAFCNTPSVMSENPGIGLNACKALIDLYLETSGEYWKNKFGRANANQLDRNKYIKSICTRYGISCDETGKLTEINLPGNALKGTLPKSFKNLSKLQELNLSKNQLSGSLASLANNELKILNLAENPLKETIPVNFFTRHPKLELLNLSNTKLQGTLPATLSTSLKELILSNNHLGGALPSALADLDSITILKLDNNHFIETLPNSLREKTFPSLKVFDLSRNYIAQLGGSQSYVGLLANNPGLRANDTANKEQYRVAFLDSKGDLITKKDHLQGGESVTVKLVKQLMKGSEPSKIVSSLSPDEIEVGEAPKNIELSSNFPSYTLKLTSTEDGIFRIRLAGSPEGERTVAKIGLSTKEFEEKPEKPRNWQQGTASEKFTDGLHFELGGKYLDQYFSVVHFNVAGNDFGGGFFWLPVEKLETPVTIQTSGPQGNERKICHNQVRGFYYNSQRGERLRPLDQNSQNALKIFSSTTYDSSLTTKGGRYTSCEGASENCESGKCKATDPYGIYGAITHTYKGEEFQLNAGVAYDSNKNMMKPEGLRCNFQRLDNAYPFGYIYDDHGHIGFVGAKIKAGVMDESPDTVHKFHEDVISLLDKGNCINDIFSYNKPNIRCNTEKMTNCSDILDADGGSAKTTLFNLGIKGIVGLTNEITNEVKEKFEGNSLESTLLLRTDTNLSKVVNNANKNAEKLCRGKWQRGTLNLASSPICVDKETSVIGAVSAKALAGKTIILKDQSLAISEYQDASDPAINLFIDKGNLLLPKEIADIGAMQQFDSFGYPSSASTDTLSKANFLKGNFIINGLLLGGNEGVDQLKNKLYIHGKLISFNTFQQPTPERVTAVKNLFDTARWNEARTSKIAMDELFGWKCDLKKGTDGTRCSGISRNETETNKQTELMLVDKAFGLIDMDFPSEFFKE